MSSARVSNASGSHTYCGRRFTKAAINELLPVLWEPETASRMRQPCLDRHGSAERPCRPVHPAPYLVNISASARQAPVPR